MSEKRSTMARFTRHLSLVILLAFVILSGVYSVVTPLFEGPDEIWHFAFANHLADGGGLPVFDAAEPATFLRNGAHPPVYYVLLAAIIAPIDRSDFPAEFRFNLANPLITQGASGTSPNLLIHTAREDWPWRTATLAAHLARFVSIALNALALWGVWQIARRILRDERLAVLALALAAGPPQFVYGAATINNDALAAATTTWLVYALLRWLDDQSVCWTIISGVMLALALLSKIGLVALLPVPALAIVLHALRTRSAQHARRHWRQLILAALTIYGLAFIIAGWWYLRNWSLYSDPLAWREWQALTGAGRIPPTLGDFVGDMIGLFGTFWIDFSLRVDRMWWPVFGIVVLAVIVGLVRRAIRREWPLDWPKLLIALSVFALLLASAMRYSLNIYNIHGRLLYPSLAAMGCVLALGVSAWKSRAMVIALVAIPWAFTVVSPLGIIQPVYARPIVSALPVGVTATSVRFSVVELVGYRLNGARFNDGDMIEVETYWRKVPTSFDVTDASGTVALIQGSAKILDHVAVTLGNDAYPIWAWQPAELIVTKYKLPAQIKVTGLVNVSLNVRIDASGFRPTDMGGTTSLGQVAVHNKQECTANVAADVTFGGMIRVSGYRIRINDTGVPDIGSSLGLCLQSLKPTTFDYTVFVHSIDSQGKLWINDSPPGNGDSPTSIWLPGDQIMDFHSVPQQVERISVGFYRLDTGERLTIDGTNETEFIIQNEP